MNVKKSRNLLADVAEEKSASNIIGIQRIKIARYFPGALFLYFWEIFLLKKFLNINHNHSFMFSDLKHNSSTHLPY